MIVIAAILIVIGLVTAYHPVAERPKGEVNIEMGVGINRSISYNLRPLSEFKKDKVVKQSYDYSCGSAALATILNYNFGEDLDETQVIQGLMEHGDREKIEKRRAFSLLDMKRFIKVLGYKGVGYRAELEDLKTLKEPGIVPVEIFGYRHFVVLKGISDNHVFVADPSQGNSSFDLNKFKSMWKEHIVFIVYPEDEEKTWHPLRLTDEDLRYVNLDTTKKLMFDYQPPYTLKIQQNMQEAGKTAWHYRSK